MEEKKFFAHPSAEIEEGAHIGKGTKIWHYSHVFKGAIIGDSCKIGQNVVVHSTVVMGNNVKVQNNVSIYDGVILEDDVFCGPSCVFTNIMNPRSAYPRNSPDYYKKTFVKKGTTIGANATILCGITVGRYAFIGAGAVVTKDVPDYGLVYGSPARLQGWMCECGEKIMFRGQKGKCALCPKEYKKVQNKVSGISF